MIVILIIVAGFWYMFSLAGSNDKTTGQATNSNAGSKTTPVKSSTSAVGSLGSLLAKGGNYTCTLNTLAADNSRADATVFASNGKTRFDFRTQNTIGMVTVSHTIRSGSLAYSWVDGQTKGTKTAITPKSSVPVAEPSGIVVMINDTAQIESDCHPWIPDVSQFTPPAGITF